MKSRPVNYLYLFLILAITVVFTSGQGMAKPTVPAGQPDAVRQPRIKPLTVVRPICPRGMSYNNGVCVVYTSTRCSAASNRKCRYSHARRECFGPAKCDQISPCPSGYERTPVLLAGNYVCRRTATPTCPSGYDWSPSKKKCEQAELRHQGTR